MADSARRTIYVSWSNEGGEEEEVEKGREGRCIEVELTAEKEVRACFEVDTSR